MIDALCSTIFLPLLLVEAVASNADVSGSQLIRELANALHFFREAYSGDESCVPQHFNGSGTLELKFYSNSADCAGKRTLHKVYLVTQPLALL